jgi:hypothetical protein
LSLVVAAAQAQQTAQAKVQAVLVAFDLVLLRLVAVAL